MIKFRRAIMWGVLALIVLLTGLSVYGAFIGAERAQEFFNDLPLAVYWAILGLVLIIGLATFRRLIRVPGLLLVHVGCILILAGAAWSSQTGHQLQKRLFGLGKTPKGQMFIYEGKSDNQVILGKDQPPKTLPFSIKLKDFRIEYYEPQYLQIWGRQGQSWRIPVEIGKEVPLGADFGTVEILRAFQNFRMTLDGEKRTVVDDPRSGSNPALEVQVRHPDGRVNTRYVFELFPGHSHAEDQLSFSYHRVISDYISELQVIENDKVVAEKDIEVNHPLHYGGYHFYQHSYDNKAGRYTVLSVTSDTGVVPVFAGYWMLCVGVIWHLWLRHIVARKKLKST